MDAAEVVGHGVRDVVAHAHRAGVVMRRAEVVAAVLERGERGEPLRPRAGGHRNDAGRRWRSISNGSLPAKISAILSDTASIASHVARSFLRLRAAGKFLRAGLGVAEMDDRLRTSEVGLQRREVDEAVGIARRHFADAADGDDDGVVGRAEHGFDDVRARGSS